MFLAWTITAAIFENSGRTNMRAGYPQVAWVWLFSFFYALAWSGLLVAYTLEILPYKLRAKGLMIMNLTVQAVLVLGKYVFLVPPFLMSVGSRRTYWDIFIATPTQSPGRTSRATGIWRCSIRYG
jgi:hypothetical protein